MVTRTLKRGLNSYPTIDLVIFRRAHFISNFSSQLLLGKSKDLQE